MQGLEERCAETKPRLKHKGQLGDLFPYRCVTGCCVTEVLYKLQVQMLSVCSVCVCVVIRIAPSIADGVYYKNPTGKKSDHIPCSKPHTANTHLQYYTSPD